MKRYSPEIRAIADRLMELEDRAVESKSAAFRECVEAAGSMTLAGCKSAGDFMAATLSLSSELKQHSPQPPTEQGDG